MPEIRELAMHFEGKKAAFRQTRDGTFLQLLIHPNDCPADLMSDFVGTRYTVAMVRLNDQDQADEGPRAREGRLAVSSSAALCRQPEFQEWAAQYVGGDISEEAARAAILIECGIESRAELKENEHALQAFKDMRSRFLRERGRSR